MRVSLSAFVPATEVHRESWTASGDLADLHASLAGACPAMHELLALMAELAAFARAVHAHG